MAISYMNTERVKDLSKHIISLANSYEIEITKLFKRLNEVPYGTKEWIGNQAEYYFRSISLDKNQYIDLGEKIKSYAKKILDDSEKTSDTISSIKLNEQKEN